MADSTELRFDALSGHHVIVADARAARPHQFHADEPTGVSSVDDCPFEPGHESMTPPEIARTGPGLPGTPGWRVRVFPNRYPITDAHEVVVLSPDHEASFARLGDGAAIEVVTMLRDRVAALLRSGQAAAVAILNHKREAGASLPHPHAQVVGTAFVPPGIEAAVHRFEASTVDLVLDDLAHDADLVLSGGDTPVWCPYASSSVYQMRAALAAAGPHFHLATDDEVAAIAVTVRAALAALSRALGDAPYNLVVHSAPPGRDTYHWYVEITPRLSVVAGFEQATGLLVNSVSPERAARTLAGAP
jgi:UDPglucose--hexose-1-phosphate uridylyltransferase